jgi:hypothetical protein
VKENMASRIIYSLAKSSAKLLDLFSFLLMIYPIIERPAEYLRTSHPAMQSKKIISLSVNKQGRFKEYSMEHS